MQILGLMSGSSLDGLDIACCEMNWAENGQLKWSIVAAQTKPYSTEWEARLRALPQQNALIFAKTHTYLGRYFAELANSFLAEHPYCQPAYIASHGHTIFHEPTRFMTIQIGDGAALAALTGIPTICDFRTQDIALGGEGTPLAPLADKYLFEGYDFYMNIGGIANVSCNLNTHFIAFDIAPANQLLNFLANQLNLPFDTDGKIAAEGNICQDLLADLNKVEYFERKYPKSLDNTWIQEVFFPIFRNKNRTIPDCLATAVECIAIQVQKSIQEIARKNNFSTQNKKIFITGGGALNKFLIARIKHYLNSLGITVFLPDTTIIQFKEASLMALVGFLRLHEMPNSWKTVTGAKKDTINGAIYYTK